MLVGVSLQESGIRQDYNLMILSIIKEDGEMVFNPSADTTIRSDEKVIAVGSIDNLSRLEKALNP
jgi:voltage-gated potassium channel